MRMVCDNPKCQYHRPKFGPDSRFENLWGPVLPNGEQPSVTVVRHLYRSFAGREIFLCDTCHSAAELLIVKGGAA